MVERHEALFPPDGSDEQWLEYCGRNGRIAITHNRRIRYTPNELAAVVMHGVALLVVIGHGPITELALNFGNSIARIEAFRRVSQPAVHRKRLSGRAQRFRERCAGKYLDVVSGVKLRRRKVIRRSEPGERA